MRINAADRVQAILYTIPGNRVFVEKKDTGKNSIDAAAEKKESQVTGDSK